MSSIKVNDVFEELSEENKRLLNELMFANKCLNILITYKTFIDFISDKFKNNLDLNECQKFEKLNKDIDEVLKERNQLIRRKQITRNENLSPNTIIIITSNLIRPEVVNNISNKTINRREDGLQSEDNINKILLKNSNESKSLNKTSETVVNDNQNNIKLEDLSNDGSQYHEMDTNYPPPHDVIDHNTNDNLSNIELKESDSKKTTQNSSNKTKMKSKLSDKKTDKQKSDKIKPKKKEIRGKIVCPHNDCNTKMNFEYLPTHVKTSHWESPFVCCIDNCNQKFDTYLDYKQHLLTHPSFAQQLEIKLVGPMKEYSCKECGQEFIGFPNYMKHMNSHPSVCHICNKEYRTQKHLKDHMNRLHVEVGTFNCDYEGCHMTFETKSNMRQHRLRVHRMTKRFKCEDNDCNKMFKQRYEASVHYKKVHSNEPKTLQCSWPGCDYAASCHNNLRAHMAVHDSQPRFVCDWPECGKAVRHRHSLVQHMDSHYNNKKYVCEWPGCTFRTVTHQSLHKHRRTHNK